MSSYTPRPAKNGPRRVQSTTFNRNGLTSEWRPARYYSNGQPRPLAEIMDEVTMAERNGWSRSDPPNKGAESRRCVRKARSHNPIAIIDTRVLKFKEGFFQPTSPSKIIEEVNPGASKHRSPRQLNSKVRQPLFLPEESDIEADPKSSMLDPPIILTETTKLNQPILRTVDSAPSSLPPFRDTVSHTHHRSDRIRL